MSRVAGELSPEAFQSDFLAAHFDLRARAFDDRLNAALPDISPPLAASLFNLTPDEGCASPPLAASLFNLAPDEGCASPPLAASLFNLAPVFWV